MFRVTLLRKAYNPGYTYLRNGKIVRVEAFSDRRVKRATAAGKRDDRTGDLFGDAGPTIDKPLKELIDDHEKVIDALESPSKAARQAAAAEQKEHLEAYREQLDTAAKVRLIEGSMDEFGGYELGGKRYTGEDAEMLVDEAREIAFATGKRVEDALLQIVPAEQLKADEPITGARAVAQRQVNAANRFVESATEQFGLSKEEAGRAWDYYVAHKLVHADPVTGQYQLKDGRFWDAEVLRQAGRQAGPVAAILAPPKLSARGMRAHAVLQSGGYFRKQLESQYRGGEKFETRLHDASGQVVPGIGYKTWAELSDAGLLNSRPVPRSTVWRSEWGLREKPLTKTFPRVKSVRQVARMS